LAEVISPNHEAERSGNLAISEDDEALRPVFKSAVHEARARHLTPRWLSLRIARPLIVYERFKVCQSISNPRHTLRRSPRQSLDRSSHSREGLEVIDIILDDRRIQNPWRESKAARRRRCGARVGLGGFDSFPHAEATGYARATGVTSGVKLGSSAQI
jgi:hypothetical protein